MSVRRLVIFVAVVALLIPAVAASAGNPGKGPKDKIDICHYPGGEAANRHTIRVSEAAWDAHHAHGDTLGECPSERPGTQGPTDGNRPPVADAGENQCVVYDDLVRLDGRGSYDPDGDGLDYLWTLVDRPSGSTLDSSDLSSRTVARPEFVPDRLGTFEFELEVDDDRGGEDADDVDIRVRMDVSLEDPPYEVDEGETIAVTILLNEEAPQDVAVTVSVDDDDVAEVIGAPGGTVIIEQGDDEAIIHVHGVEDAGLADEFTTLRVSVGSAGCSDTASARVDVVDDDTPSASSTDSRVVRFALGYLVI